MSAKIKLLAGATGLAAVVGFASPAAAQYPGYGYGYNNNPVGQIVGQILGYGQYPYGNYGYNQYANQATVVDQCARVDRRRRDAGRRAAGAEVLERRLIDLPDAIRLRAAAEELQRRTAEFLRVGDGVVIPGADLDVEPDVHRRP